MGALPEPSGKAAENDAGDEDGKSQDIQRNRHGEVGVGRIERDVPGAS